MTLIYQVAGSDLALGVMSILLLCCDDAFVRTGRVIGKWWGHRTDGQVQSSPGRAGIFKTVSGKFVDRTLAV